MLLLDGLLSADKHCIHIYKIYKLHNLRNKVFFSECEHDSLLDLNKLFFHFDFSGLIQYIRFESHSVIIHLLRLIDPLTSFLLVSSLKDNNVVSKNDQSEFRS